MKYLKPVNYLGFKYDHVIGTGGIGSGIIFNILCNHTIGRNESREGDLLPSKDYCKFHIVTHYLASLLGTAENRFKIFPIGKIGNDSVGRSLFEEMRSLGLDMKNVKILKDCRTLFSVCFQYPDFTGGNITSANSASSKLSKKDIFSFFNGFAEDPEKEIILTVPEVPLDPRLKLLEIGRSRGSFNAGSVSSFEIEEFNIKNGFKNIDLLTINIDEASTIASIFEREKSKPRVSFHKEVCNSSNNYTSENNKNKDKINDFSTYSINTEINSINILESCINLLIDKNPNMMIAVTDGPNGSYGYYNGEIEFIPVIDVGVKATSGAGDAFMAGILAGLCCGLSFLKGKNKKIFSNNGSSLNSALELGALLASLSVTSIDTINFEINAVFVNEFKEKNKIIFGPDFKSMFREVIRF